MVAIDNPNDYILTRFEKSNTEYKKYDAILLNKSTGRFKRIPFGDKRYQQYKDSTGLNLYSHLNHLDKKRRDRYRLRHRGENNRKFSSGWFSWYFLW